MAKNWDGQTLDSGRQNLTTDLGVQSKLAKVYLGHFVYDNLSKKTSKSIRNDCEKLSQIQQIYVFGK